MRSSLLLLVFAIFALNFSISSPYKIVGLFPHPGPSHFKFFEPLLRGLAKAGHDVTIVSFFPLKNPPANYTDLALEGYTTKNAIDFSFIEQKTLLGTLGGLLTLFDWGQKACDFFYSSNHTQKILSGKPYDVVLVEEFNAECLMGLAYLLDAPVVGLTSSMLLPWYNKQNSVPFMPPHNTFNLVGFENKNDFLPKLFDFIAFHSFNAVYDIIYRPKMNALVRKYFGDSIPDVTELSNNVSIILTNQHFATTGLRVIPPNVIEVGGLHLTEPGELEPSIKKLLDRAKQGAVYISWGSQVRADSLPESKRLNIVKIIRRFDEQFLWKWENETMLDKPQNLYVKEWMPQQEILCHPNVKLFISHGGQLGASEAIYCGVPMVVMPMFGDQFANAISLKEQGIAEVVPYHEMSETKLYDAIKKMLDPKVQDLAKDLSVAFRNRPISPLRLAIWWVEHIAMTKGNIFVKAKIANSSWHVFYSFDIYAFVILMPLACLIFNFWLFKKIICCILRRKTEKKPKIKTN